MDVSFKKKKSIMNVWFVLPAVISQIMSQTSSSCKMDKNERRDLKFVLFYFFFCVWVFFFFGMKKRVFFSIEEKYHNVKKGESNIIYCNSSCCNYNLATFRWLMNIVLKQLTTILSKFVFGMFLKFLTTSIHLIIGKHSSYECIGLLWNEL